MWLDIIVRIGLKFQRILFNLLRFPRRILFPWKNWDTLKKLYKDPVLWCGQRMHVLQRKTPRLRKIGSLSIPRKHIWTLCKICLVFRRCVHSNHIIVEKLQKYYFWIKVWLLNFVVYKMVMHDLTFHIQKYITFKRLSFLVASVPFWLNNIVEFYVNEKINI